MLNIIYSIAGILLIIVLIYGLFVLMKLHNRINFIKSQEKLLANFIENNSQFIKIIEKFNNVFTSQSSNKNQSDKKRTPKDGIVEVINQIDKHQGNIKKIIDKGKELFLNKKDKNEKK